MTPPPVGVLSEGRTRLEGAMIRNLLKIVLFTVDEVFGGWKQAQAVHFSDGGPFDQIYQVK
jgi:ABC-type sulfate transport system substrate-binding protein